MLRAIGAAASLLWALPAAAQTVPPPPASAGFWERPNLLGDMGGVRTALRKVGITFGLQEISEALGNVTGGVHTGADYDGVTMMSLSLDTDAAFRWAGGIFNLSALQIHGRSLSADNLDDLQTASGIEADRATRLWEFWYEQAFLNGAADVRIGQQSIDQEFLVSQYSGLYLNTMMGWPMVPSVDLYTGGPAYPLSSPGVRLRAQPSGNLTLLAGVFDDNPPGGPFSDDPQTRDGEASGTRFNLGTGALFIGELQYAVNPAGAGNSDCGSMMCGLPGTYKLGGWYDTAAFPDQRFDADGLSLANPASSGTARMRRGNFSLYGVADQTVWREAGGKRQVGVFVRIMGAPGDRNLVDLSVNAGVNLKAPLPGRAGDTFGIGYGLAHVGGRAGDLARDEGLFTGAAHAARGTEHFIEVTYQIEVAPWWQLQPDFQYVINPGGGIQNPQAPARRVGDEAVFGLRTTITF